MPNGDLTSAEKRTRSRLNLDMLVEGTEFCARQAVSVHVTPSSDNMTSPNNTANSTKSEAEVNSGTLDSCCRAWQACTPFVDGMSFTTIHFPYYLWSSVYSYLQLLVIYFHVLFSLLSYNFTPTIVNLSQQHHFFYHFNNNYHHY